MLTEKHIKIEGFEVPKSLSGKRMVFLTDIHFGSFLGKGQLKRIIDKTKSLSPDVVLLGGDHADGGRDNLTSVIKALEKLETKTSKPIGVFGNHEYELNDKQALKTLKDNEGVIILKNENLLISEKGQDKKVFVAGLDDLLLGEPDLKKTLAGTTPDDYVILLSHNPDISEKINSQEVDLVLSGHTHGGQLTFFGLWAPVTMSEYGQKYVSGIKTTDFGKTITSNGLGSVILPMRFFARPQIIVLDFFNPFEVNIKIGKKTIKAEVADEKEELQKGLMGRNALCQDCGMLFIFKNERKHPFWMKNTHIPLDIVFLNQNKKVVDIKKATPCLEKKCSVYKPNKPALYALEVAEGTFSNNIIGSQAELDLDSNN